MNTLMKEIMRRVLIVRREVEQEARMEKLDCQLPAWARKQGAYVFKNQTQQLNLQFESTEQGLIPVLTFQSKGRIRCVSFSPLSSWVDLESGWADKVKAETLGFLRESATSSRLHSSRGV